MIDIVFYFVKDICEFFKECGVHINRTCTHPLTISCSCQGLELFLLALKGDNLFRIARCFSFSFIS